jgi:hypothetical protein
VNNFHEQVLYFELNDLSSTIIKLRQNYSCNPLFIYYKKISFLIDFIRFGPLTFKTFTTFPFLFENH